MLLFPSPQHLVQYRAHEKLCLGSQVPNKHFAVAPGCLPFKSDIENTLRSLTLEPCSAKFKVRCCCLLNFYQVLLVCKENIWVCELEGKATEPEEGPVEEGGKVVCSRGQEPGLHHQEP